MSVRNWLFPLIGGYILVSILLYCFASPTDITLFFQLLNFAALVAIAAFIYRSNLGPQINDLIRRHKQKQEVLVVRHDELIREQHILAQRLEEQDQLCRYLLIKIDIWHDVFEEQQRQHRQEHKKAHEMAEKKAQQQAQWLTRERLYKRVIDEAVDKMRIQLEERFKKKEQQEQFVDQIIVAMRKSIS